MDKAPEAKPGGRTKAALYLLLIAWGIVLADILGVIVLFGRYDLLGLGLHNQLEVVALLSLPFVLVAFGAVVTMIVSLDRLLNKNPLLAIGARCGQ